MSETYNPFKGKNDETKLLKLSSMGPMTANVITELLWLRDIVADRDARIEELRKEMLQQQQNRDSLTQDILDVIHKHGFGMMMPTAVISYEEEEIWDNNVVE